jgi:hypothetical protein
MSAKAIRSHYSISQLLIFSMIACLLLVPSPVSADEPIEITVSLKVQQITGIDQKSETFGAVVALVLKWNEPGLAIKPGEKDQPTRMFPVASFIDLLTKRELSWPAYSFYNLQGRVDYQNEGVTVDSAGNITLFARLTAKFQAPDFDFRHFPLDEQSFDLKLDLLPPLEQFIFKADSDSSGLGDALGEEEWILTDARTTVTTHHELGFAASRFVLTFDGHRHLNYYFVRILIPAIIIILVSWFTFFLSDYPMRINLASGNLLLFIAFNFTIANDLPRLGYLTLMDTFLLATFAITGFGVLVNVWLRRLQNQGKEKLVKYLDRLGTWSYPLYYAGAGFLMIYLFYV